MKKLTQLAPIFTGFGVGSLIVKCIESGDIQQIVGISLIIFGSILFIMRDLYKN